VAELAIRTIDCGIVAMVALGYGGSWLWRAVIPVSCVFCVVKASSRRNAWGNLSYADLITKAIESSPEKRLTLSQIYAWMVSNVPFFSDKGDSNSSAGWKVCQNDIYATRNW